MLPKRTATVGQIVEFYLNSDHFANLKGNTQKQYEAHLNAVLATRVLGKRLEDYRARSLKAQHTNLAYQEWLKVGTRTANYRKAALSTAWKYCMRLDIMENDPVKLIKTTSDQPRKVRWTREQVSIFLDTAYSDFKWRSIGLIVHMAYECAQRVGDMRVLTWDKVNLEAQRIDLTQSKRGADVHLPIPDELTAMLEQQKYDFGFQTYVAPKTTPVAGAYVPYPVDQIDDAINEVKDAAGLPKNITAMDLRRTAITEMVEGGADLAQIMQVSGHRNPGSVKPYMVNTFTGAKNALAKRGGRDEEV
ncbi:integrase [Roseobacter phage CRP-2]|nr:integrase [Roseobacter phage CRP-2]